MCIIGTAYAAANKRLKKVKEKTRIIPIWVLLTVNNFSNKQVT